MKQTKSQSHGSQGEALVIYLIKKHGDWLARAQPEEDFGIDVEAELCVPSVSGQLLKIQSKASGCIAITKMGVICRVKRKFIHYADSCRVPVILVAVDLATQECWYVWMQEWIYHQKSSGKSLNSLPGVVSISIPVVNTLESGLDGPLRNIAQWKTSIQIANGLLDAVRAAIATESTQVVESILGALKALRTQTPEFPIDYVITEVMALGGRIWGSHEGNRMTQILYTICREHGERFTSRQIRQLVVRGNAYSRTGINALGLLYEHFPNHLESLKLSKAFAKDDPHVGYFCKLRERNKGSSAFKIAGAKGNFSFDGWKLAKGAEDVLFDKIANRGDSALLDYLVLKK